MTNDMDNTFQDLASACQEIERLREELAEIKKERAGLAAAFSIAEKGREELKSEKDRLATDYRNLRETYSELFNEHEKLKSENARLASEVHHWRAIADYVRSFHDPQREQALRDLLAPTIELLESWAQWRSCGSQDKLLSETTQELSRLRAACGDKEKK